MNGLMTALEHDIPIVVVVFNNKALGWVLHGSGPFAAEFKEFDHAAIARAMGCRGTRVEDPAGLAPALQEALAARVPTVIDVMTSLSVSFADITSQLAKDASAAALVSRTRVDVGSATAEIASLRSQGHLDFLSCDRSDGNLDVRADDVIIGLVPTTGGSMTLRARIDAALSRAVEQGSAGGLAQRQPKTGSCTKARSVARSGRPSGDDARHRLHASLR